MSEGERAGDVLLTLTGLSLSEAKGAPNTVQTQLELTPAGITGDRHGAKPLRQVSLLDAQLARDLMASPGHDASGVHKEHLRIEGLQGLPIRVMDRLHFGEVVLEVTRLPRKAGGGRETCIVGTHGYFARILHGGSLRTGQTGTWQRRTLSARILTLSDRASAGVYEDRSGPAVLESLRSFCAAQAWSLEAQCALLPDDPSMLESTLLEAIAAHAMVVFTTGGTGVGPRDTTPEVVLRLADRSIPGIMEHIRHKYGTANPLARLSRGVVAQCGTTLIYTLPGSTKAVAEYMAEIPDTLEHLLLTLQGLEAH